MSWGSSQLGLGELHTENPASGSTILFSMRKCHGNLSSAYQDTSGKKKKNKNVSVLMMLEDRSGDQRINTIHPLVIMSVQIPRQSIR